ncbi:DMT family transporter [Paenibacillus flagellatus]|uniref:EamA family transporter n=1 Tax=Paenibacillus flagellatus TaxID=2211139 RepID=A0A2V5K215_9BACL|nr:DMT family transporter [Paenibacillus flagellatus]PYI51774.1 EamA family transporter [Paenibacillus flagellatus]
MKRNLSWPAAAALAIGVTALSTSAIFVKLAEAPSAAIAAWRMSMTALLFAPLLLASSRNRRALASMSGRQWGWTALSGVMLAAHYLLWFESLRYTSVTSSTVLVTLQPLFSFAGAYLLFGERLSRPAIGGGVLAVAGSFVIGWGDMEAGGRALLGDAMALLGAGAITAFFLIGQRLRAELPLAAFSFVAYGASGAALFVYALAAGVPLAGYAPRDWALFAALAVVPTLLGQSVLNGLVHRVGASTISMAILGEPVGTSILAYFVFGERVTVEQAAGGAIVLIGIFMFMANGAASGRGDAASHKEEDGKDGDGDYEEAERRNALRGKAAQAAGDA